ncbi:DMT family transporter [Bergeyella sp. RCAD1439]|uniref:DMT family transporter n=1 Tax=Bergeyella anatis TaxID=3113737 RepID=UPI002E16E107|nr:multidrug efflux SMR transporter [Bergeyella sp. RCAD1439]
MFDKNWIILFTAIVFEIIATSFLKVSNGFRNLFSSVISIVCYIISFYCLALALRSIPLGISYAIWSGVGIVILSLIGYIIFDQKLNLPTVLGILLILVGTIICNIYGKK